MNQYLERTTEGVVIVPCVLLSITTMCGEYQSMAGVIGLGLVLVGMLVLVRGRFSAENFPTGDELQ